MAEQQTALLKVRILGDDNESMLLGEPISAVTRPVA